MSHNFANITPHTICHVKTRFLHYAYINTDAISRCLSQFYTKHVDPEGVSKNSKSFVYSSPTKNYNLTHIYKIQQYKYVFAICDYLFEFDICEVMNPSNNEGILEVTINMIPVRTYLTPINTNVFNLTLMKPQCDCYFECKTILNDLMTLIYNCKNELTDYCAKSNQFHSNNFGEEENIKEPQQCNFCLII